MEDFETLPVQSAAFFKTKNSSILLMLKSKQRKVFCHLEAIKQIQQNAIFQGRGGPQSNINKTENRYFSISRQPTGQHQQNGKSFENVILVKLVKYP